MADIAILPEDPEGPPLAPSVPAPGPKPPEQLRP
jgi:hypothetical protein